MIKACWGISVHILMPLPILKLAFRARSRCDFFFWQRLGWIRRQTWLPVFQPVNVFRIVTKFYQRAAHL